jgi:uncharacterized protein YggE
MKRCKIILLGLLLLLTSVLSAVAAEDENVSKIIVQGEGKVNAAPDMAIIVLGVETRNLSASDAVAENARLMSSTIAALLDAGVEEKNIQTSQFSLTTRTEDKPFEADEAEERLPPEFIATNRVTVRINNTENIGSVLDAAVAAGSNSIQRISFDLQNPQPEKDQALALAVKDARRKADIIAMAAGVNLSKILEISEGYASISPRGEVAFAFAPTPIQAGELEITASVTTTYEVT